MILLYRLPPEPSAPRVATWRALQRLDGGLLQKGVYVARATPANLDALRTIAHDVRNFGGDAAVVEAARVDNERLLRERVKEATR